LVTQLAERLRLFHRGVPGRTSKILEHGEVERYAMTGEVLALCAA
jgi:hypothetical protein